MPGFKTFFLTDEQIELLLDIIDDQISFNKGLSQVLMDIGEQFNLEKDYQKLLALKKVFEQNDTKH